MTSLISKSLALALLCSSSVALAGVDLRATISAPSVAVYQTGTYSVTVKNLGNTISNTNTVSITLPATHTSPSVYVMGTVGAMSSACSLSGTTITCNLGQIKANKSKTVTFDLALPQSSAPLTVTAVASAVGVTDTNAFNNTAPVVPSLSHPSISFTGDQDIYNEHCTGTGLTSFFECVVSPGSIMGHDTTFHSDGTISFPGYYYGILGGSWSQPTPETLHFEYTELGTLVMTFDGSAVDAACWEGVVSSSGYTIPYSVCLN